MLSYPESTKDYMVNLITGHRKERNSLVFIFMAIKSFHQERGKVEKGAFLMQRLNGLCRE